MGTPFTEIYDMFLYSLQSDNILSQWQHDPEVIEGLLQDYLFESSDLYFTECIKDLSNRDDEKFNETLNGEEKRILALGMKIKYLSANLISDESYIAEHFFTKDYKVFSPANRLKVLLELEETERERFKNSIRVYQYNLLLDGEY